MSVSTQVMIVSSSPDSAAISYVNEELDRQDTERHQQFAEIRMDLAGGTQPFELHVWAAAFNYEIDPRSCTVAELRAEQRD